MSDVSAARQKLRDLSRTQIAVFTPGNEDALASVDMVALGSVAGQLFVTIQAVLTVTEEMREEAETMRSDLSPDEAWGHRIAQLEIADRIEAAVLKGLS